MLQPRKKSRSPTRNASLPFVQPQVNLESSKSTSGWNGLKKRKADDKPTDEANGLLRAKRAKTYYNDNYRKLYNSVIEDHLCSFASDRNQDLVASWIGSTVWSAKEKNIFFHLLARKGRHSLSTIAKGLRSKSETEIRLYVELLGKGLVDAELSQYRPSFVHKPSFDAAHEISDDCMAFLDCAGEALSIRQQARDTKAERKMHGKLWLLTPLIGDWTEKIMRQREKNEVENEISRLLPPAVLLNLKQLLWLSKRFFMNSSDLEFNWTSYAKNENNPTIMYTAFSDLYTLVVDITKRLVRATLHLAISRLKVIDQSDHPRHLTINRRDVAAASSILGVSKSPRLYWSGVARRCNLGVFEHPGITFVNGKSYSHDEVELLLANDQHAETECGSNALSDERSVEDSENTRSETQSLSVSGDEVSDTGAPDIDDVSSNFLHNEDLMSEREQRELRQDENLEIFDQRQSQSEELRLWDLLGKYPTSALNVGDETNGHENIIAARKDKAELVDWTSWGDHGAEWEMFQTPVPAQAFQTRQRKTYKDGFNGKKTVPFSDENKV